MRQITAAILGFGDRSRTYSRYALSFPDKLKITAIVEPDDYRREEAKAMFSVKDEYCFSDFSEFVNKGKIADCVINGTMDELHIKTTLPLLPLGYDVLLEKPITSDKKQLLSLMREADKYGNNIIVCHVLRYTSFYSTIKKLILDNAIGEIRSIETSENVGIAHASIAYIRGKWGVSKETGSSYMMAKCCHDYDLLSWLNSGTVPVKAASFGSRNTFIPQKAPKGAGTRCLTDCNAEKECPYSCYKMHILNDPMPLYVWRGINKPLSEITTEEKLLSLKTDNPHGGCIFKTKSDIIDQQVSIINFANGSVATHTLTGAITRAGRRIFIHGTKGEIEGYSEDNFFTLRKYVPETIGYSEERVEIPPYDTNYSHMGGDKGLMDDFTNVIGGGVASVSTTKLKDSIYSHLMVMAVDEAMQNGSVVEIENLEDA